MKHTVIATEVTQPQNTSKKSIELVGVSSTKEVVGAEEVLSVLGPSGTVELVGASSTKEVVSAEEVLSVLGPSGTVELKDKVAFSLVIAIIAVISIAIISVGWEWLKQVPPLPSLSDPNAKVLIGNYKALREVSTEQTVKILDEVVTKVFMPILTALFGYAWGKNKSDQSKVQRARTRSTTKGVQTSRAP